MSFTSNVETTNEGNSTDVLLSKILLEITKLNEKTSNQIWNEKENLNLVSSLASASGFDEIGNIANEALLVDNVKKTIFFSRKDAVSVIKINKKVVLENQAIVSTANSNNSSNYNLALIDKIDDIYFRSSNETGLVDEERKKELTDYIVEMEKDLEEFSAFSDFVHPDAVFDEKEQEKIEGATEFVNDEYDLTTSSYYNIRDIKKHLKAESIVNEFTGYAVNLVISNEALSAKNSIFNAFGGLKVEKTINGQYRYFIDNFKTKKGTKDYLEKIILPRFPDAAVVFYKKGQRKNKTWQFFFGPK